MSRFVRMIVVPALLALSLWACHPEAVLAPRRGEPTDFEMDSTEIEPTPIPGNDFPPVPVKTPSTWATVRVTPPPTYSPDPSPTQGGPLLATRRAPTLSAAGNDLIVEYEVGGRSGYKPHAEAPDAMRSGITWGVGYDGHQNAPEVILVDWVVLGRTPAKRLAATNPYYGRSAQAHLHDVADIIIPWMRAYEVFTNVDVAREYAHGKQWPGFVALRPNAQAALMSQGFNRGWATAGPNRSEMREMERLVPSKDYHGIAVQMRKSIRVWRGTQIEHGMTRRRFAEARLMETP